MASELQRPGVEVFQNFRTTSPTVTTPTLQGCVVGVAKQTLNAVNRSATGAPVINTQAEVSLPAALVAKAATGSPAAYTGLNGKKFIFSVRGGEGITVTIVGNSLTPAGLAAQVRDQLLAANVSEVTAEKYGTDQFRLVTVGRGVSESIEVLTGTDTECLTAFGWVIGYVYTGSSSYTQSDLSIPVADFPDPEGNLDELVIEPATVRAFLRTGGADLRELSKSEAFLRRGGGGYSATVTGTVAVGTGALYGGGGTLAGQTLSIAVDGGAPVSVTFTGGVASQYALRDMVNAAAGFKLVSLGTNFVITSPSKGTSSTLAISGTAAATLGFSGALLAATGGYSVSAPSVGNGALTSVVSVLGADFTAAGTNPVATGVADISGLTYPGDLAGKTLTLSIRGGAPQELRFGTPANQAAMLGAIAAFFPEITPSVSGSRLVLTLTGAVGTDASFKILGGSACDVLGLVPSLLGSFSLANLPPNPTVLNGKTFKVGFPTGTTEVTFTGLLSGSTPTDIASFLNAQVGFSALGVASIESGALRIRARVGGVELNLPHTISILTSSGTDAAVYLGFSRYDTANFYLFEGNPNPPAAGDDFYLDGQLVGRVIKVAPNGAVTNLKLDKSFTVNANYGLNYSIRGRNLSSNVAGRPDAELVVAGDGMPSIKQDVMRDVLGVPLLGSASVYLSFRAIRLDVTASAKNPSLLTVSSTTELEGILPVSADNPLGLGMYLALLNAPGVSLNCIGVDAVSADSPYGTVEAFTRAAEFLEAYEVYAIAPLTNDPLVGQVFSAHVTAMSEPEQKGERIVVFNHAQPTQKLDTLVASGTNGNSVGATGVQFDTGIPNLTGLVQNSGVNPVGTIPADAGLFLDIGADAKRYNIASISGSIVVIRISFSAGENDDGYYATTDLNDSPLPSSLINQPYAVRVRGASLTRADGLPDKQGMAETYQALGFSIANRRFINMVADKVAVSVGGIDQLVEGFYGAAVRVGQIAGLPPQQSFTNYPMVGLKSVSGTNKYFSEKQLKIIGAGGNDILVQDTPNGAVYSRHALTTDMTSIETRTDIITRCIDYTAKFVRTGVRSYIGRMNITQGFIDTLSNVFQGLFEYLVGVKVLAGGSLANIIQDEDQPDAVIADCTLEPPYPCNYIRVHLAI